MKRKQKLQNLLFNVKKKAMIGNLKSFIGEVSAEMKKVSWPPKEQLKESTYVVIFVCLAITAIISVMDLAVSNLINLIF